MSSTTAPRPVGLHSRHAHSAPMALSPADQKWTVIALVASMVALVAIYWNQLSLTKDYWNDDTYSHGWIIPFLGLFLLWNRRDPLGGPVSTKEENRLFQIVGAPAAAAVVAYFMGFEGVTWLLYAISLMVGIYVVFSHHTFEPFAAWERWIGVGLITLALLARLYGTYKDIIPIDRFSFMIALFGVFFLVGGIAVVQRFWAPLGFFIFMMPLPSVVEQKLLFGLQKIAAIASTAVLQILGVSCYRAGANGSQIIVPALSTPLDVAEACSGLRMLTIFSAMVIALVLLIERPWWDKLILLLSAIPIALATNIIRITATALLFLAVEGTSWQEPLHDKIHDYTGYAMIFFAGGLMWLEYKVLTWLFVEEGDEVLQATSMRGGIPIGRS
ncbi:exosortase/archaeosortase family protein [Aeoliella sp. SH292]|uniref:exosortase/archaeosortase family protein n=1 Tax=Aeoliella sp. SH292 TaxID=3454464 RepID=UPI003F9467A3